MATASPSEPSRAVIRRHLVTGWSMLLGFLTLGLLLETLHGFKVGWYVDVNNETRRLMWTLAHAHGVLLGLVNIAYAATLSARPVAQPTGGFASTSLLLASLLLPAGFLLGGLVIHDGDPGLGILLTPIGGLLLFTAVATILRSLIRR